MKQAQAKHYKLLKGSEIALMLDSYDDIFSGFDPRSYAERALSTDFLQEAKLASRDKEEGIELKFMVPSKKRNKNDETIIQQRLHAHFKKHYHRFKKEANDVIKQGLLFILGGIILMYAGAYIHFNFGEKSLLLSFLIVMLEPGGWFLLWEGLNLAIFEKRKEHPDLVFYRKMGNVEITFTSY